MTGLAGFTYAQARLQARYGKRADSQMWLRLHSIHDFTSYLQTAQHTSMRPWVLGISSTHSSHEIELILRQKYRRHIDEVAGWVPKDWQAPLQWIKRLPDLPVLQHLLASGPPMDWMKLDPDLSSFTVDDPAERQRAMRNDGCSALVSAWHQGESIVSGWLSHWHQIRPRTRAYDAGLRYSEQMLQTLLLQAEKTGQLSPADYEAADERLGRLFRRYALQPAGICTYLAVVAMDLHRLRSDLMRHVIFQEGKDYTIRYAK